MTPDALELLRTCPLFEGFQPKHLDRLVALAFEVRFDPQDVIFKEGEDAGRLYIILSGRVQLDAEFHGRHYPVEILYAGDQLGWSSGVEQPRRFRAKALEPVRAVYFEIQEVRDACLGDVYFGRAFYAPIFAAVIERLQNTRLRLAEVEAQAEAHTQVRAGA
jgi:CRP/FNR family transcriptional regulator, cyclic AMP receptor protein